jgi:hypothetical protein
MILCGLVMDHQVPCVCQWIIMFKEGTILCCLQPQPALYKGNCRTLLSDGSCNSNTRVALLRCRWLMRQQHDQHASPSDGRAEATCMLP